MPNPSKLPVEQSGGEPPGRPPTRPMWELDFDTPNEDSMQFLEEQWSRFCKRIGLQEVPDIRAILAAYDAAPPRPKRRSHWLVRPFVAAYRWLNTHPY